MGIEWTRQNVIERFPQALEKARSAESAETSTPVDNGPVPAKGPPRSRDTPERNAVTAPESRMNDRKSRKTEEEFSAQKER